MDLILDENALVDASTLFGEGANAAEPETPETKEPQNKSEGEGNKPPQEEENSNSTTEVVTTAEQLFANKDDKSKGKENNSDGGNKPESVGSEEKTSGEEGSSSNNGDGTSPNSVISSFAKAMKDDGYLQNLDDDTIAGIKDAQSMADAIDKEVEARLSDEQKRIKEALDLEIPTNTVKYYTQVIGNLNKIDDELLNVETDQGKQLRYSLIYQDYRNNGKSDERAKELAQRAVDNGTDIEDAKDALESNKSFFKNQYDNLVSEAKAKADEEGKKIKQEAEELKNSMLNTEELLGIKLDKKTRQKAYEAISKPVFRNADGEQLTAIQKFADENPVKFRQALGILFTLTDDFKSLGSVINKETKKQVKNHLSEFEKKIVTHPSGGSLAYVGNDGGGSNSQSNRGWLLDIGSNL